MNIIERLRFKEAAEWLNIKENVVNLLGESLSCNILINTCKLDNRDALISRRILLFFIKKNIIPIKHTQMI